MLSENHSPLTTHHDCFRRAPGGRPRSDGPIAGQARHQAYLDALSDLVGSYEDEHFSLEPASDAYMLRHLLDAKGITQAELHRETGISKSSISEVFAGKKPLSRQMIRKLAAYFAVDVSVLAGNL